MRNEKSKTVLQEFFGDYPLIRVLDFLLENRLEDHSKTEIARGADVGWTTLFQVWGKLEKTGIVTVTRKFGKTKLYKINAKNQFVRYIKQIEFQLIKEAAEADAKEEMMVTARRKR